MKYFELKFDAEKYPDCWHLHEPRDKNGQNIEGQLIPRIGPLLNTTPCFVPINFKYPGKVLDFSFGAFSYLLVKTHVADLIERFDSKIQRFPVQLSPTTEGEFEVIVTLDCIKGAVTTREAEEFESYTEDDHEIDQRFGGIAPRQKGMLYKIYPLKIDAEKVIDLHFFRLWEYMGVIVVSEALKNALQKAEVTGIMFEQVS